MGCCSSVKDDGNAVESTPISQSRAYKHQVGISLRVLGEKDRWYHGNITHQEAETRLRTGANGVNGMYLVYDSPSRSGQYVLLVYNRGEMHRWTISQRQEDEKFIVDDNRAGARAYETVQELLNHYSGLFGKALKLQYGDPVKLRAFVHANLQHS